MYNKKENNNRKRGKLGVIIVTLSLILACMAGWVIAKYAADIETDVFHIYSSLTPHYYIHYMDGDETLLIDKGSMPERIISITKFVPEKEGASFLGWSQTSGAAKADYKAGDSLRVDDLDADITDYAAEIYFYAVWEKTALSNILVTGDDFNAVIPSAATAVEFTDAAAPAGAVLTDVSAAQDMGVVAWLDADGVTYKVSTQRAGIVALANPDSTRMFYQKKNITRIDTTNLDTSICETMLQMFFNCTSLKSVDVSRFDTSKVTDISGMFYCCFALEELNVSKWDVSNVTTMRMTFAAGTSGKMSLKSVGDLSKWDTSKTTNMSAMFQNCESLKSVGNIGEWDVSNVTDMRWLFNKCSSLTNVGDLSKWDVSKVTSMCALLQQCSSLESIGDLSKWNTANVTNMNYMFGGYQIPMALTGIGDLSNWNTSNVTTMEGLFQYCENLKSVGSLSKWDVSKVTSTRYMFNYCYSLTDVGNLGSWNTSNMTDMGYMFAQCSSLTNVGDLNNWDTSNVTSTRSMFADCINLKSVGNLSNWNVSSVTDTSYMFCGMSGAMLLTDIGDISNWDMSRVTGTSGMFQSCNKLTDIKLPDSLTVYGSFFLNHVTAYSKDTFTIGKNITKIGKSHVFYDFGADNFKEFKIEDGNTCFKIIDGCLYTADGSRLINVPYNREFANDTFEIPEGVTFMNELSFSRNKKISTLILPDSYTIRFCEAKDSDYDNENLNTGSNLAIALYSYTNVSRFEVKDSNPKYISKDGCIYSKDGSSLIAVPDKYTGDLSVADGTTAIEKTAVRVERKANLDRVTKVTIPASVTTIDEHAMETINAIGCPIEVDSANPSYTVVDGKLTSY